MTLLITGYPYVRQSYLETFDFWPESSKEKDELFFALPKEWKVKKGKVVYTPPARENVFKLSAYFHHSDYPLIGGLLKGWMPGLPRVMNKVFGGKKDRLLFSATEPILLTTLFNGICAKLFGAKHVVFTWENIPYGRKFRGINLIFKKAVLKLNMLFCDGLICGNKKARDIHAELTKKPMEVIPLSGLDAEKFKKLKIKKEINGKSLEGRTVLAFAGAIDYRKGIHILLPAFKKLLDKNKDVYLILVGSGTYEKEIHRLIKDLDLAEYITKLPWVDHNELLDILSVSDVFVYPSIAHKGWEEQFGYSMAEASLCELPVIATHSGSIEEVVKDGETGILVKENNIQELTDAMKELICSLGTRKELGKNGREFIIKKFSNKAVAEKMLGFFRGIL